MAAVTGRELGAAAAAAGVEEVANEKVTAGLVVAVAVVVLACERRGGTWRGRAQSVRGVWGWGGWGGVNLCSRFRGGRGDVGSSECFPNQNVCVCHGERQNVWGGLDRNGSLNQ